MAKSKNTENTENEVVEDASTNGAAAPEATEVKEDPATNGIAAPDAPAEPTEGRAPDPEKGESFFDATNAGVDYGSANNPGAKTALERGTDVAGNAVDNSTTDKEGDSGEQKDVPIMDARAIPADGVIKGPLPLIEQPNADGK